MKVASYVAVSRFWAFLPCLQINFIHLLLSIFWESLHQLFLYQLCIKNTYFIIIYF
jgi:hypothetical protein